LNEQENSFRPERVVRPREQVELQIRSAVLAGRFRPGDKLPSEAVLAKQFGVSRSTVREALRALAEGGFIRTVPGATGGSFVAAIDYQSLSDSFGESVENILRVGSLTYAEVAAIRLMLEVPSARLAARTRTDEDIAALEAIVDDEKRVDVSDPAVPSLNSGFHQVIARASRNRLLEALISALHHVTHPLTYIDTSPELGRQSVVHHIRIVAAIKAQDEDEAAAAMEEHLTYLRERAHDTDAALRSSLTAVAG
jgi:GntR family transcriptional repressor for pyruvate dehydrogenase complex